MIKLKKTFCSLLLIFSALGSIQEANALALPTAGGWMLGEQIYGYPIWHHYYRYRVLELGRWPVAIRYQSIIPSGPMQRYEIQVTPYGRVSVIAGYSNYGSLAGCKAAQAAIAPGVASLAEVNKIGFIGPIYNLSATCTPTGTLAYHLAFNAVSM